LIWGAALAMGALWIARAARAQEPAMPVPAPAPPAPTPAAAAQSSPVTPPAAARASVPGAAPVRRTPVYAPEAARTASRLADDERATRAFLRAAAQLARIDVEASRIVIARSQDTGVLAFASDLIELRRAADAELLHLLQGRAMAPPLMDDGSRKGLNRLQRMQGARLDREYMDWIGGDQQREAVEVYERALATLTDPVVRAWVERQLPQLRQLEVSAQALGPQARRASRADAGRPGAVR
jgi:putative membrane protein